MIGTDKEGFLVYFQGTRGFSVQGALPTLYSHANLWLITERIFCAVTNDARVTSGALIRPVWMSVSSHLHSSLSVNSIPDQELIYSLFHDPDRNPGGK